MRIPIPNITEMLRRIGQHKPKLFGIMDLTQGYHQAPLEHNTKAFTAFITFSGVYEFTRLPSSVLFSTNYGHCSISRFNIHDV